MKAIYAVKQTNNLTGKSESFIHLEDKNGIPHYIKIQSNQFDKIKRIKRDIEQEANLITTTKGASHESIYVAF